MTRLPSPLRCSLAFAAALLPAPPGALDALAAPPMTTGEIDGVVRFSEVEGGCWKIETVAGISYEPVNLHAAFKRDGLAVRFRARPFDGGTICMVGRPVEISGIRESDGRQSKDTR